MTTTTINEPTAARELSRQPKQEAGGAESTHPGPLFTPAVDIYETDAAIVIVADMPGVTPANLDIDLRDNVLTIEGRVEPATGGEEAQLVREFDTGGFRREFRVSKAIDRDGIDATLREGVLHLSLPKAEQVRPRKIEVRSS